MGSQSALKLPRIDFFVEKLQPGSDDWHRVRNQVRHALETYGCFEAVIPNSSLDIRMAMIHAMRELFALPVATKVCNKSNKPFHGYVGQLPTFPLFESLGIDDSDDPEHVEKFTKLMWPEGNSSFSETVLSFSKSISELDHLVRKIVLDSLGLMDKYYDSHIDSTSYLLRMMRYKAPESTNDDAAEIGLRKHTDKNMITVLLASQDGLEVQTKDGEWFPVAASPDSVIVTVGDALMAWTNGRMHSPFHQVTMTGNEERFSVGLFSIPKAGHIIQAPEELVDEEHPLLFRPYAHVDFLNFFCSDEGRDLLYPLTVYCGTKKHIDS